MTHLARRLLLALVPLFAACGSPSTPPPGSCAVACGAYLLDGEQGKVLCNDCGCSKGMLTCTQAGCIGDMWSCPPDMK